MATRSQKLYFVWQALPPEDWNDTALEEKPQYNHEMP